MIGEHGDSELAVWSGANICGLPLKEFCEVRGVKNYEKELEDVYYQVRNAAYEIIKRKGSTYYGIAMAVSKICQCISNDEHTMLPVSVELFGTYGLNDIALSIPSIVGQEGIETVLELQLSDFEKEQLKKSADSLKAIIEKVN